MRTVSPRSVSCVGQPASGSSSVVPASVNTPSPAWPVASIASDRPSLLDAVASMPSTTRPQRGMATRPFENAARPSSVGSATVPPTSRSTATAPAILLELRRQEREEADVGPLDVQRCRHARVARAHVGDLGARRRRCRRSSCALRPSASSRPSVSVMPACTRSSSRRECLLVAECDSRARGAACRVRRRRAGRP